MIVSIFNIFLKTLLLVWLLTLERVIGLPVIFLALSWGWLDELASEKIKRKYVGLVFFAILLAVVYQISFVFSVSLMILGLGGIVLTKKSSISTQWKWVAFGIMGAVLVGLKIDFQWSWWSFAQIIISSFFISIIKKTTHRRG